MELDNNLWKTLQGGYKTPYDVSLPLKQLEKTRDKEKVKQVFEELWNELHHQGDVGLASYLAIPQLVRIAKSKELFDWNILALCAVIEQQRHFGDNPSLPTEYQDYYENGLKELKQFVISNMDSDMDDTMMVSALSALATCSGQYKLGKAILNLEGSVLDEFLEQY